MRKTVPLRSLVYGLESWSRLRAQFFPMRTNLGWQITSLILSTELLLIKGPNMSKILIKIIKPAFAMMALVFRVHIILFDSV